MNIKKICLLILIALSSLYGQKDLDDYLQLAAENNPGLKAKFHEYMAAMETISQAGVLPDPEIAFGYFIQPVETRLGPQQYRLSLMQMFPWFGTLGAKKEAAAQRASAKFEMFADARAQLSFDVKSAYYELYFIRQSIHIAQKNLRFLKTFRDLAVVRVESGDASSLDALRAEMAHADLENSLARLEDLGKVQTVRFNVLLNRKPNDSVEIADSLATSDFPLQEDAALDIVQMNNHAIARLDHLIKAQQSEVTLAAKSGLPQFSIGVDYIGVGSSDNPMVDTGSNGNDAILFPKISITLPLYRKKYSALGREARQLQQAVSEQKTEKINMLEFLFEKTYSEYMDANRRIALFIRQSRLADQSIQILETEYAADHKNFEEILRMEERLLKYSLELVRARCDKQASIAFMTYLMGQ